ncbi:kinase-like domain-containing protein [Catenaria anguillulae PL171]|uniref:Kinase-like domain-containing protein n=1 Tax=Catenaria anguillulae PL171 TaxID=765915 RepID=A0A1Y2I199_9FUNG|nr:kinase-like domain-containing protein [Catenaria anguillulae PL171]
MPYTDGGDLVTFSKGKSPEEHLRLLHETAQGMAYLHSRNVFHGDLKGKNVLIDGPSGHARVCDFGQSRLSSATTAVRALATPAAPIVGNVRWIAPERYDPKAEWSLEPDVFAFAMVVYEVVSGKYPFQDDDLATDDVLPMWIMGGHRPKAPVDSESFSQDLWDLVEECWDSEWKRRPSFLQVVQILSRLHTIKQDVDTGEQVEANRVADVDQETLNQFNNSLRFREPLYARSWPHSGSLHWVERLARRSRQRASCSCTTDADDQHGSSRAGASIAAIGPLTTSTPASLSTLAQPPAMSKPPAFSFAKAPSTQPPWPCLSFKHRRLNRQL